MYMASLNSVITLDDLINFTDQYDIKNISYLTKAIAGDTEIITLSRNLLSVYQRYVEQFVQRYTVSDYERQLYRCRPHLLSTKIYGTPNLAWMIMQLNYQECPSKFKLKSYIRLIPQNQLDTMYDTIVAKAKNKLEANWIEIEQ